MGPGVTASGGQAPDPIPWVSVSVVAEAVITS